MSNPTNPQAAPAQQPAAQAPAGQPAAAPKKKPTRLGNKDIMRVGEWMKGNAARFIAAGISPAGVARAAGKQLQIEGITANTLTNIGAAVGVTFPESNNADRLAKLEDVVLSQLLATSANVAAAAAATLPKAA
jgi:hypothetical protein